MTDLIHRLGERCSAERRSARQELVQDRPRRINVRGRPDRQATRFDLLGTMYDGVPHGPSNVVWVIAD